MGAGLSDPGREPIANSGAVPGGFSPAPRLGWTTWAAATATYAACLAIATYPSILTFRSTLPALGDPLQHLWIMHWFKSCLLEGRWPFVSPDVHYPVGSPLGYYSPMPLATSLYLVLSAPIPNDVLCYNLIWTFGFLSTGLGTFWLAWRVLGDRACAGFAGLSAMLSGPMMMHARGHLELIQLGAVPVFLASWISLMDRPNRGRLWAAAGLFLLVAASAAYFVVLIVFPATLYVGWAWIRTGRGQRATWLRARAPSLAGFVALVVPALLLLFASQLWTMVHGLEVSRPGWMLNRLSVPWWSYLVPTHLHGLGRGLAPIDHAVERGSYLGAVTLVLLVYAAVARVRFPGAGYWWSALVALALLSFGNAGHLGTHPVSLPLGWFREVFPPLRLLRAASRFNLLAALAAAVLAAAGLNHLLSRLASRRGRGAAVAVASCLALADLAIVPFHREILPAMPACYDVVRRRDPRATLAEAPHFDRCGHPFNSFCVYWQPRHGARTTAGSSGQPNLRFEDLLLHGSPFHVLRLSDPNYLSDPDRERFGAIAGVGVRDYIWLYLTAHGLHYLVLHQDPKRIGELSTHLGRLKAALAEAKIFDDSEAAVYERARLRPPTRPVLLCTEGWRYSTAWQPWRTGRIQPTCAVGKVGKLCAFNPKPERELRFILTAAAFRSARTVRLVCGGRVLHRWLIRPGTPGAYASLPLRLPAALGELALVSDSEEPATRTRGAPAEGDGRPTSILVHSVGLMSVDVRPCE